MSTVAQILKSKPVNQPVRTLPPDATVREAIELMAEHRIGALLVAEGDRIVGIFTERDYARKIEVRGRASADTRLAGFTAQTLGVKFGMPLAKGQEFSLRVESYRQKLDNPANPPGALRGLDLTPDLRAVTLMVGYSRPF